MTTNKRTPWRPRRPNPNSACPLCSSSFRIFANFGYVLEAGPSRPNGPGEKSTEKDLAGVINQAGQAAKSFTSQANKDRLRHSSPAPASAGVAPVTGSTPTGPSTTIDPNAPASAAPNTAAPPAGTSATAKSVPSRTSLSPTGSRPVSHSYVLFIYFIQNLGHRV
jgi:hypothetical protein